MSERDASPLDDAPLPPPRRRYGFGPLGRPWLVGGWVIQAGIPALLFCSGARPDLVVMAWLYGMLFGLFQGVTMKRPPTWGAPASGAWLLLCAVAGLGACVFYTFGLKVAMCWLLIAHGGLRIALDAPIWRRLPLEPDDV